MTTGCGSQLASLAHGECENGDYLMATKMLTTSMRLEPNNHELYHERSICYYKLGDYQASLEDANTAIRLGSDNIMTHYQKGLALLGLATSGDLVEEAIKTFKKAIELKAKREDSKLSEIWKLLKESMNEIHGAKIRLGLPAKQALGETAPNIHQRPPQPSQQHLEQNSDTSSPSSSDNEQKSYQHSTNHNDKPKEDNESTVELYIDVDDSLPSTNSIATTSVTQTTTTVADTTIDDHRRVMSSMPATTTTTTTTQQHSAPSTSTAKDDSYSSKYKRLRRDRERARRGTSKLCTIKLSDLEELQKSFNFEPTNKKLMRVIAPIDGWLYSGQLSYDSRGSIDNRPAPYVVKLDGDLSDRIFYFNQETVLNDVIKEVRVKSVSELRKGARICCYWSRQYKCLSTGVVTSRTFEATKSLVSVKYDNGDLSALPLEDLRLLPPDYPKYMSNCDPLLLSKNGNGNQAPVISAPNNSKTNGHMMIIEQEPSNPDRIHTNGIMMTENKPAKIGNNELHIFNRNVPIVNQIRQAIADHQDTNPIPRGEPEMQDNVEMMTTDEAEEQNTIEDEDEDDDATIPPTDETIDFITSENTTKLEDSIQQHDSMDFAERVSITKDIITSTNSQLNSSVNLGSEVNSYGIEYCPWIFEGPPTKRNKRHGRTYRDVYHAIRRGNDVIRVGDSAELMPKDSSILPFIAKIDGFWSTTRGEMKVRVRWYYRLAETKGEPYELHDGENALFETDHFDENDVQSIYKSTRILSWTDYEKNNLGHVNKNDDNLPKIFYLAGYYDPVRCIKHLRTDVKEAL